MVSYSELTMHVRLLLETIQDSVAHKAFELSVWLIGHCTDR